MSHCCQDKLPLCIPPSNNKPLLTFLLYTFCSFLASFFIPKNIFTGLVRNSDLYFEKYKEHKAKEYIIEKEPQVNILNAKYLLPMVGSGGQIDGYYRITNLKLREGKLVLKLGEFIPLGDKQVSIYQEMRPGELINLECVHRLYHSSMYL